MYTSKSNIEFSILEILINKKKYEKIIDFLKEKFFQIQLYEYYHNSEYIKTNIYYEEDINKINVIFNHLKIKDFIIREIYM